jgi:phosphoribosylaminoimidazole-succinocarboxamide synthase
MSTASGVYDKYGALMVTNLNGVVPSFADGKVRDVYDLGDRLLIVATDRISTYDSVHPNGIPGKGKILTEMSLFWFERTRNIVQNHVVTADVDDYPANLHQFRDQLEGRSMLVERLNRIDVECVARGYITGSGWRDYQKTGAVCGIQLPERLMESQRLDKPIFTPATKAEEGHDTNISFEQMVTLTDETTAMLLRELTLAIYGFARKFAEGRNVIIADTKFEFGVDHTGSMVLIDEILSPDSSRFWDKSLYEPGRAQNSFDKQYVRDYVDSIGWDHSPPAPELPFAVVARTLVKYEEARDRLLAA